MESLSAPRDAYALQPAGGRSGEDTGEGDVPLLGPGPPRGWDAGGGWREGWDRCAAPQPYFCSHTHLADEGGVGEGGPDVGVLVELMILGQLWGRQAEGEVAR